MIKNIGIITTFKANNYGAELQAFATQQKLRDLGYNAELIDYLFYKNRKYRYSLGSEPWTKFGLKQKCRNYILYRVLTPIIDIFGNMFSSTMKQRTNNFRMFHKKFSHTSKTYYSQKELYLADMHYDVYCVGSDQVWNPNTAISIAPHFLTFAPSNAKKISYASSFGVSSLPIETIERYRCGLSGLSHISCREEQGVQLIKELIGQDAELVLDPTLLLTKKDWEKVSEYKLCPNEGKYILIYNIVENDAIYEFARRISRDTGWPIFKLCKRALFLKKYDSVHNIPMAGPSDFLGIVENAGIFLTNSFHGCAFAVNFRTPFWAIIDRSVKNNSRIESILDMLDLDERLLGTHTDLKNIDYNKEIDFDKVHSILTVEREKSLKYLIQAIEN